MPYKLSIPGQVTEYQLRAIEAVASLVPAGGTAVEIGSLFGRSSYAWGSSIPASARLFCIDPWSGNEGVRQMEERLGVKYGLDQFKIFTNELTNLTPIQGSSPRDVKGWESRIDLFYEDSVHQNPTLHENLVFWSSFLRSTGVACGDDFRPRFPDVMNEVKALASKLGRELIIVEKFWCLLPAPEMVPAAASVKTALLAIQEQAAADAATRPRAHTLFTNFRRTKLSVGDSLTCEYVVTNESPVDWRDDEGNVLKPYLVVRIHPRGEPSQGVSGAAPLAGALLPDIPLRGELRVSTDGLQAGQYSATTLLLLAGQDGKFHEISEQNQGVDIEIVAGPPDLALPAVYAAYWEDKPADWNAISEVDVHAAYRIALGRPPEGGPKQVANQIGNTSSLATLRQRFLSSPEFYRNNVRVLMQNTIQRGRNILPDGVEVSASAEEIKRLFDHIQKVWSRLGEIEPHYSVLSAPEFKPDLLSQHEQVFYASGEPEVAEVLRRIEKLADTAPRKDGLAVELGCGVGRVTRYLATHFASVAAYDISNSHLDLARRYLDKERVGNVNLQWLSGVEVVEIPAHDFFYSRIVLQHNPPPIILYLLRIILSKLKPGGFAAFQLLTGMDGYHFSVADYLNSMEKLDSQELHALPQQHVFNLLHELNMVPVEIARDSSVTGFDKVSTMFIARKTAATKHMSARAKIRHASTRPLELRLNN